MSYNIGIVNQILPKEFDKACTLFNEILNSEKPDVIDPVYQLYHDGIIKIFPCISSLSDDEIKDGVWSDGPLINNFKTNAPVIGIVASKVKSTLPIVVKSALELGLYVLDWSTETVYFPNNISSVTSDVAIEYNERLLAKINDYAEKAESLAYIKFDIALDYSDVSIARLEEILTKFNDALPKNFFERLINKGLSAEELDNLSTVFGCYLGKVMQSKFGGVWIYDSNGISVDQFPILQLKSEVIRPIEMVREKIKLGQDGLVLNYFLSMCKKYGSS